MMIGRALDLASHRTSEFGHEARNYVRERSHGDNGDCFVLLTRLCPTRVAYTLRSFPVNCGKEKCVEISAEGDFRSGTFAVEFVVLGKTKWISTN
jgi:hypothetical protein